MKKNYTILLVIIIPIIISSCSTMYIPSNTNTPLLAEKGEKQIDLSTSWTGMHLSGNFAFYENYFIALNGNYSFGNFLNYHDYWEASIRKENNYNEFSHSYAEIGIGRYNLLKSKLKLEVFSGIGYGYANEQETISSTNTNLNYESQYYLGFLQCNLGFRNSIVQAGGGLRLAYSNFNYRHPVDKQLPITYEISNFYNYHLEPILFVKVGKNKIKFTFNMGISELFTYGIKENTNDILGLFEDKIHYTYVNFAFGVSYSF